jgi:hypothetical protein
MEQLHLSLTFGTGERRMVGYTLQVPAAAQAVSRLLLAMIWVRSQAAP